MRTRIRYGLPSVPVNVARRALALLLILALTELTALADKSGGHHRPDPSDAAFRVRQLGPGEHVSVKLLSGERFGAASSR